MEVINSKVEQEDEGENEQVGDVGVQLLKIYCYYGSMKFESLIDWIGDGPLKWHTFNTRLYLFVYHFTLITFLSILPLSNSPHLSPKV
jgi:hypothetical protein